MHLRIRLEQVLLHRVDQWVAHRRQPRPSGRQLAAARIVAHRGIFDNRRVFENTLPAFDAFQAVLGWGIELDVRWTRDAVPVVSHDPDGRRLFSSPRPIADMNLKTLQQTLPLVPTLAAVIDQYGGRMHLMVELKFPAPIPLKRQRAILQSHFDHLTPGRDYHLICLDPLMLGKLQFTPAEACVPIAQLNLREVNRSMRAQAWGGMAGHYALISHRRIADLHNHGRQVGTGYINSRNCLYREVARGVDWLFSDRALALQGIVARAGGPMSHERPA